MIKQATGVSYTPKEFRKLNQCVQCGIAGEIDYDAKCGKCSLENISCCNMCDSLLREGKFIFYTYDIKDDYRDGGINLRATKSKKTIGLINEFTYESEFSHSREDLCDRCIGWEDRKKNLCWKCGIGFTNTKENYKLNGNMCEYCSKIYKIYD